MRVSEEMRKRILKNVEFAMTNRYGKEEDGGRGKAEAGSERAEVSGSERAEAGERLRADSIGNRFTLHKGVVKKVSIAAASIAIFSLIVSAAYFSGLRIPSSGGLAAQSKGSLTTEAAATAAGETTAPARSDIEPSAVGKSAQETAAALPYAGEMNESADADPKTMAAIDGTSTDHGTAAAAQTTTQKSGQGKTTEKSGESMTAVSKEDHDPAAPGVPSSVAAGSLPSSERQGTGASENSYEDTTVPSSTKESTPAQETSIESDIPLPSGVTSAQEDSSKPLSRYFSSLEELEEQVGFDLKDIRWLPFDGKSKLYSTEDDGAAVIRYLGTDRMVTFYQYAKGVMNGDDRADYLSGEVVRIAGGDGYLSMETSDGRYKRLFWEDGGKDYIILSSKAIAPEELITMAESAV